MRAAEAAAGEGTVGVLGKVGGEYDGPWGTCPAAVADQAVAMMVAPVRAIGSGLGAVVAAFAAAAAIGAVVVVGHSVC